MSEDDIQIVFNLYSNYKDEIEKVKVVSLDEIREKDYILSVNSYIEKKEQEVVPPEVVRQNYFDALQVVKDAEEKMKLLLIKGGYINE
jgi:type I restriction enzyme M protein